MSGKRRRPYAVRKTVGWHVNPETGKTVQEQITIGYAATRAEGLQMLAEYNNNPFDIKASKATFQEVYERWSKEKFPTISKSNVKGYEASYRVCGTLYNKVFRDIRLMDLQFVVDTCEKNYPTLKKLKGLFNQLYAYAMKNDICNKDYSEFVDLSRYKDKNPNKRDRNKFTKEQIARLWELAAFITFATPPDDGNTTGLRWRGCHNSAASFVSCAAGFPPSLWRAVRKYL